MAVPEDERQQILAAYLLDWRLARHAERTGRTRAELLAMPAVELFVRLEIDDELRRAAES